MVSQKVRSIIIDINRFRHRQLNLRIGTAGDMGRIRYSTVPKYSKMKPGGWYGGGSGAKFARGPSRFTHNRKRHKKLL